MGSHALDSMCTKIRCRRLRRVLLIMDMRVRRTHPLQCAFDGTPRPRASTRGARARFAADAQHMLALARHDMVHSAGPRVGAPI